MIGDFNKVARYLAYTLEILVLFMVQETPGLLPSILGGAAGAAVPGSGGHRHV